MGQIGEKAQDGTHGEALGPTGYYGAHVTKLQNLRHDLERNFLERDGASGSAEDPNNRRLDSAPFQREALA